MSDKVCQDPDVAQKLQLNKQVNKHPYSHSPIDVSSQTWV